jgi:hypothetical protein
VPQTPAGLTAWTAPLTGTGFVFGTAAGDVRAVEVTLAGGRRERVATTAVPDEVLRRSRMRGGFRVYVVAFRGGLPNAQPQVTGLDADGGEIGTLGRR